MSKPMVHKGYSAQIEYSDEDGCFVGRVSGIRDIITFHGESVQDLRHAFTEAVDFYLESCAQRGEAPIGEVLPHRITCGRLPKS